MPQTPELSIIVTGLARTSNPAPFLEAVARAAAALNVAAEILVIAPPSDAAEGASGHGERVVRAKWPGAGGALRTGIADARGSYILTVDPDFSGPLEFIGTLWDHRRDGEIVIASRYVDGSDARMPPARRMGSRALNVFFGRGLSLHVRDLSSGLRLYRTEALRGLALHAKDYDVLQEILVRAYAAGWHVVEVPIRYAPNADIGSKARVDLARAYLRTFWSLWKLRNSILAADYDYRAHDSPIWLQRYWQRSRYRHITDLIRDQGAVLDVGCGSSHIIGALPRGSVAIDVLMNKLRFARRFPTWIVRASGFALPFADASFPCVLCSQVIEHVPMDSPILSELIRVLAPGGRLVLGTPDYDNWEWVVTEKLYGMAAPGGYADEHISHYSRRSLLEHFSALGFTHEDTRYILRGELILALRKPA